MEQIKIINIDFKEYTSNLMGRYFDLCITDPPYGVELNYDTYIDTFENWKKLMLKFVPEITRVCKMTMFTIGGITNLKFLYDNFPPDWLICWNKGSPGIHSWLGFHNYEIIAVYGKLRGLTMGDHYTLVNTEKKGNYGHPCPKPIKWYKMLLGDINKCHKIHSFFEPFMGSGSGLIAAYDLGIKEIVGTDIDKKYCKNAQGRIDNYVKQKLILFPYDERKTKQLKLL
jgi:DNA modification methylase